MVQENVETLKIVDDEEIQHLDAEATQQPEPVSVFLAAAPC